MVSIDNVGGQASVTEYICERLQGKGKIAHLQGNQDMETGRLRTIGLHGVVERYPEIELVHEVELDWGSTTPLRQQGAALARSALAAHPDLDAILTTSDECAFGVYEALRDLGVQDKVVVAGFDALPEALIAIEDGWMEASAYQPMEMIAEQVLNDVFRLVRDDSDVAIHTQLAAETISRKNLGPATLRALQLFPEAINDLNQRRAQQQASATFLEALIDNLPDIVFVKEVETLSYVRRNRAADEWSGVARGFLLGRTAFDIFQPEVAARLEALDREVLHTGIPADIKEEVSFLDGRGKRYIHARKVPIYDTRGRPAYLLGVFQDITERTLAEIELAQHSKELEAAIEMLEKNREKLVAAEKFSALGSLVADVAHELNTPIGNGLIAATTLLDATSLIAGRYAQGLSRSMLESYLADARDGSVILERNLHRAANLINSFKQIAIDQNSTETRIFSLATVVSEVLETLWPSIKKTPFKVHQSIPDDIMLNSYPGPLEQVLINLINNALIHGLDGRPHGQITISAYRQGADRVNLLVEDDGKGIPEDQRAQVFDPFFTTKADDGGTGLGLSISHSIVTGQLGGEIEVTSEVGVGTRFTISIPLTVKPPIA
jgi:PAS domain S-box-containing protein